MAARWYRRAAAPQPWLRHHGTFPREGVYQRHDWLFVCGASQAVDRFVARIFTPDVHARILPFALQSPLRSSAALSRRGGVLGQSPGLGRRWRCKVLLVQGTLALAFLRELARHPPFCDTLTIHACANRCPCCFLERRTTIDHSLSRVPSISQTLSLLIIGSKTQAASWLQAWVETR